MKADDDIKEALNPVVLFQIDAEKGEGIELAKQFKVKAYPTFVLANRQGSSIDRWVGYDKGYLLETLSEALSDLSTVEEKLARFEKNPSTKDAVSLGRYYSGMLDYKKAVDFYRTADKLNSDPSIDYLYKIFASTADGARREMFTFEEASQAADKALASKNASAREIIKVALAMSRLCKNKNKEDQMAKFLRAGLDASAGSQDENTQKYHTLLSIDYNLYVTGDTVLALKHKKASMPNGWQEDAAQLNSFAWWCFENKVNLEEAGRVSIKGVELAEPGKQKAQILDTAAEIFNAQGNTKEAIRLIKMAIAEAPDDVYYAEQLERFQNARAASE